MNKEVIIYIGLFLFLSMAMHFEQWTSTPLIHLQNLPNSAVFGLTGVLHPIVFTLIAYLIIRLPFFIKILFFRKGKMKIDCD